MSGTPETFIRRAIQLAEENAATGQGGPFGCIIVKDGRVIAEGTNLVSGTNDPTAHAEIVAIRAACEALGSFQLTGCHVYASCEPCPMCLGAIYWARPAVLYYAASQRDAAEAGFDDAHIREQLAIPDGERSLRTVRLETEEAKRPFDAWKASQGKVRY